MNSSDNMSNLTESQQKIKKYFEKYNVEETLADMLNTLAHAQDEKPISFMVKKITINKFQKHKKINR